jgi:hypothetical protein
MTLNILNISTNNNKDEYKSENKIYVKKKNNYLFSYINNIYLKNKIIDYLYEKIDLSNYNYNLIKNDISVLDVLKKDKYYMQLNYSGIGCYLIFIKIKDNYFSALVEKKTLCFNKNKLNINNVKIRRLDVSVKLNIFNGTIFEGFLIFDNNKMNITYLINDIFYLAGNKLVKDKLEDKFSMYSSYIENNPIKDKYDSNKNTSIHINKFHKLESIKNLISDVYNKKSKFIHKKLIKGLSFVKEVSGQKIIYLFNNKENVTYKENNKKVYNEDKSYRNKKQYQGPKEKIKKIDIIGDITSIFEMKKTSIVDVYDLYLLKVKKDKLTNKIKAKKRKFSLAFIPTVECSNFCKFLYNDKNQESVLVECNYLADKDKWVPSKLIEGKKNPDRLKKVEEKLSNINL